MKSKHPIGPKAKPDREINHLENSQVQSNDRSKHINASKNIIFVGIFLCSGVANGRKVYEGPKGGIFFFTPKKNKMYLTDKRLEMVSFIEDANET